MTLQTLLNQAVSLHRNGRLAEAEGLYRQVLAQAPANYPLQYRLALLQFQQQRTADALTSVTAALAIDPQAVEALTLKGGLLAAIGRHNEALAHFDRALALKPGFADALNNRALVLTQLDRLEVVRLFNYGLSGLAPPESGMRPGERAGAERAMGKR